MANKTRVVELKDGQDRKQAPNAHTMVLDLQEVQAATFQQAFISHYAAIRSIVEGYRRPGIALIAIDGHKLVASACVAAKRDRINVAIIGRHGMADVFLPEDPGLSLRHLVMILHPLAGGDETRLRVVDLRTTLAFQDERGQRVEALEAEGAIFLGVGRYLLLCFPTGEETPWPDDPQAGWECVPERVYLDNAPAEPDRWKRRRIHDGSSPPLGGLTPAPTDAVRLGDFVATGAARDDETPPPPGAGQPVGGAFPPPVAASTPPAEGNHAGEGPPQQRRTLVQPFAGPSRARRSLLGEDEKPLGALRVRSEQGVSTIIVGPGAAREGVLFGRYERCDNDGLTVLSNGRISRVHMLLIEIAGRVYAIDAASTNGIWVDGQERRVVPLKVGRQWMLGDKLAWMEWLKAK